MALKTWNEKEYQITGRKNIGSSPVGSFMESSGSLRLGDNRVGHLFVSEFGTGGSSNSKLQLCNDLQVDLHNRYVDFAEWSCRQLVWASAQVTSGRFHQDPSIPFCNDTKKGAEKAHRKKPSHYSAVDISSFLELDYSWALLRRTSHKIKN
jgi:hypothetical protein